MTYSKRILALIALIAFVASDAEAKIKKPAPQIEKPNESHIPLLKPIQMTYDVYVGGMHLLEADFLFHEKPPVYSVSAHIKTRGFWDWALPWHAEITSDGRIIGDHFEPQIHKNTSYWKDEGKTVWMRFDNQRNVKVDFEPYEKPDEKREIVTPEQSKGSLDPLSVILQLLADLSVNNSCVATEKAFDGKRRFDLISEDRGFADSDPQGYGLFKGQARRCDIYFKMVAGKWTEREHSLFWQYMDGEKGHEPFKIWMAKLSPELPELAVRLENQSAWGRIVVHLKDWKYVE